MKKLSSCDILNYIYKITSIIVLRTETVNKIVKYNKLNVLLNDEIKEYNEIIKESKELLKKCKGIREKVSLIDRISNSTYIKVSLKDNYSKLDKILIADFLDIVNEINKKLDAYNNIDAAKSLLNKLRKTVEKNMYELKKII